MTRLWTVSILAGLLVWLGGPGSTRAATNSMPDFQEVYGLIRAHAAGVTDAELNRAAVQGLLKAFGPNVSLVTNETEAQVSAKSPPLAQSRIFENHIAYLRVARVGGDLAKSVNAAYRRLSATNKLQGVVLDLRYADGADYAAAAATADLFIAHPKPLLNWGDGMVSSKADTNAIRGPVAVLVNHETSRAAEALAAVLRQSGRALILGSRTAGEAMVAQDFPLKNGERLRIGIRPVTLGDGSRLTAQGVKPDISVAVRPAEEHSYYTNEFWMAPTTDLLTGEIVSANASTSSSPVRMNEAELVREHNAGLDRDTEIDTPPPLKPQLRKPVVTDPVLARALDLLKGLAVVGQDHF